MTDNTSGVKRSRARIGKRQLVCFLSKDMDRRAYAMCLEHGTTRQAMLAIAINSYLKSKDLRPRLSTRSIRVFRIPSRKRSARQDAGCRTGKSAWAGWFAEPDVIAVSIALAKIDMNVQEAAFEGLQMLLSDETIEVENIQENIPSTPDENEAGDWSEALVSTEEPLPEFD